MLRAELSWKPEMLHLQQADMLQTDTCSLEMADKRRVRQANRNESKHRANVSQCKELHFLRMSL